MTILLWILLLIFVLSLITLLVIALRHLPQVRVLNVETDAKAQSFKKKEEIILQRLSRGSLPVAKAAKAAKVLLEEGRRLGRRSVHRLRALEEHYRELKQRGTKKGNLSDDQLVKALDEAGELAHAEEYVLAEKKYIEIISLNPRSVKAYEYLGRLYTKMKQFDQAEQCLRFAAKLRSDDASVRASLGELYMQEEQWTRALEELGRAVTKRPANAKYLDRYLETALRLKNVEVATEALARLKSANPENQKIEEFEVRLSALQE